MSAEPIDLAAPVILVGILADRPDGRVHLSAVKGGKRLVAELGWREAIKVANGLLEMACAAGHKAGQSDEELEVALLAGLQVGRRKP